MSGLRDTEAHLCGKRRRVAVIGSGIAGLGAAYALRGRADVTLYEAESRIGGHTCTVEIDYAGTSVATDIGFIVYNRPNYPNLSALFETLGVRTHATDMSFAVSDPAGYEWAAPLGLFAWKRNLVDRRFLGLLQEIIRFNSVARKDLAQNKIPTVTLGAYLEMHSFSERFRHAYLLPMGAAIWSTPEREMLDYPVASFIAFFDNHRLMHAIRPTWRTVVGGSRSYVAPLLSQLDANVKTGCAIASVTKHQDGLMVMDRSGAWAQFDAVILATHADQSMKMLDPKFERQRRALSQIRFSPNSVWLHSDADLMPSRRNAWACWNVLRGQSDRVCVTYWMNRLQKLATDRPVFVTLNPVREPKDAATFGRWEFEHPVYDTASAHGRADIEHLQGQDDVYFAGAWLGDGFHEAGLRAGIEAARALGGETPWEIMAPKAVKLSPKTLVPQLASST